MDDVLLYLSIIHNGDWFKIYDDITNKKPINKKDMDDVIKKVKDNYITLLNENYPQCLKSIYKPPFVLFYKGNIDLLASNNKKVAIIGSRENSEYGKSITKRLCKDLVNNGSITIVSGLAKGIDSIAHKTCLECNGNTIAVLGNGLNVIYPKENKDLYEEIAKKGLIISEYPFDSLPEGRHFLDRNRIIAGISDGITVTEAKVKSGTMSTVCHGLESGKQIFCVPDKLNNDSGCNLLIKEGAKLIENAQDILDDL